MLEFQTTHKCHRTRARCGAFKVRHGHVVTPVFMPVGTMGTVKSLTPEELIDAGAQIILGNTYHLYLRPGPDIVARAGGLAGFMSWRGLTLTDSGGFQIFSMADLTEIGPEGVTFKSHLDGSKHFLTPENIVGIQSKIGADMIMVLDECTDYPLSYDKARKSVELTIDWARRSRREFEQLGLGGKQAMFGIVSTICATALIAWLAWLFFRGD